MSNGDKSDINVDYDFAMQLIINDKKSFNEVEEILLSRGLDTTVSVKIIESIKSEITNNFILKKTISKSRKKMIYGASCFLIGLIITVSSYISAFDGNSGSYSIFYGIIIYGVFEFIKGSTLYSKTQLKINNGLDDTTPEVILNYCVKCKNYDSTFGTCSQIHDNVKNYPKKFSIKCNGKFFLEF